MQACQDAVAFGNPVLTGAGVYVSVERQGCPDVLPGCLFRQNAAGTVDVKYTFRRWFWLWIQASARSASSG